MRTRPMLLALFAASLFCLTATTAWAQRPAHYYPVRPPITPYLFYSSLNTTGLPNYYTYVRPSVQFQSYFERAQTLNARNELRTRYNETEITGIVERQLRLRETTGAGAPAVPGSFFDLSHYYQASPAGARRR